MRLGKVLTALCLLLVSGQPGIAAPANSPVEDGRAVYRSNCAFCHGLDGRGGRGPNIASSQLNQGSRDEDLERVVQYGIPGTAMPAFPRMEPDDTRNLIAFIRHLRGSGTPPSQVSGDPKRGRALYVKNGCGACHRIEEEGSVYGPDLTRIGAARSLEYIVHSISDPSGDVPEEFQGVTVVTSAGKRITGVRINEDNFTVQLRDMSQQFHMFDKSEVREVVLETRSLMPPYALAKKDMDDLLAYLVRLRGEVRRGAEVRKVEGIQ